jgi:hypothetical protein
MEEETDERFVAEVPTSLKRKLKAVLAHEGKTLRQWLIDQIEAYVVEDEMPDPGDE